MKHLCLFILLFICLGSLRSQDAQKLPRFGYPNIEDRQLIGTKWRYTYTTHLESNTTIHQAEKEYQYFLNFRYDYSFEQFLNGKMTQGNWSLSGATLFYPFRNILKFEVAEVNNKTLILEFTQPNNPGTYQYHFMAVDAKDAPFVRPAGELPVVVVEAQTKEKKKRNWWTPFAKSEDKSTDKKMKEPTYISIELIGGGFYGGIDPVVKDFIEIKSDGRLIQEFQTVNQPLRVVKKNIPRAELEIFAEYINSNHFFDLQRLYDCNSPGCEKRKVIKPMPIPLRLMVAYGEKKKVITLSIWGQDNRHLKYMDYPPALDNIIDAIQKFAHRIEDPAAFNGSGNKKS